MANKNRTHTTHTQYYTEEGDFRALCKTYPDGNYKKSDTSEWFQLVVMDIEFTWFLK